MKEKFKTVYICSECGETYHKWQGQCSTCKSWNTIEEDVVVQQTPATSKKSSAFVTAPKIDFRQLNDVDADDNHIRIKTGIGELDRVLGGGIVQGAGMLIGGEPGAGKSTLLLQICGNICKKYKVVYISGEESVNQIKLRANRLGIDGRNIAIASETDVLSICQGIEEHKPDVMVIDSIQTMNYSEISSSPGSVSQVRESTALLLNTAKRCGTALFIVGHVNKDGAIAGPKVMEHIVDTVLYFEGDRHASYRILRAVKNRFGSTNEIGVFEMQKSGLIEVENPSEYMLSGKPEHASGSVVVCAMEGTRPMLMEIQALVCKTNFGMPRRTAAGLDYNRINLLMAVLEKRLGLPLSSYDAYVNIAGGIRVNEPAIDLGIVMALVSSYKNHPISDRTIAFGEIGLSGEVRAVAMPEQRVAEAKKLGFKTCIVPEVCMKSIGKTEGIEVFGVKTVKEAIALI